jgi:hypothetical protein
MFYFQLQSNLKGLNPLMDISPFYFQLKVLADSNKSETWMAFLRFGRGELSEVEWLRTNTIKAGQVRSEACR